MNLLFWELLLSLLLVLEEVCIFERIISSPKFLDIFLLEVLYNTVEIGKGGRAQEGCCLLTDFLFLKS